MFREVGLCVREWVEHYFHCGHAMLMSKTVAVVVRRAMSERMKKFLEQAAVGAHTSPSKMRSKKRTNLRRRFPRSCS